jgi:hypothetical protein
MLMNKTDWQRYLESFIQEVKDYKELSTIDFYIKYCTSWNEISEIVKDYERYRSETYEEDRLTYEEWLEEVYYEENQDDIDDRVREYREPSLDCIVYKDTGGDYMIYEVTLAWWWPNIYVTLSSRWNNATYQFRWWSESIDENLSYLYDEIYDYLNLDIYEY